MLACSFLHPLVRERRASSCPSSTTSQTRPPSPSWAA